MNSKVYVRMALRTIYTNMSYARLEMNPKPFHIDINMKHKHIAHPLVGLFALVWMKMQIHSLPLDAAFGA